ncbi:hypothetical protein AX16_009387 [Volvariella volvacea WC 439]|nr:hypothetical protein AX16_009387 [Volvariella volvacea WC 439]
MSHEYVVYALGLALILGIIIFAVDRPDDRQNAQSEVAHLRQSLRDRDDEIEGLRQDLQRRRNDARNKEETLQADNRRLKRQIDQLNGERDQLTGEREQLEDRLRAATNEMQSLKAELTAVHAKHAQVHTLLAQRTDEWKAAEAYLGKADKLSGQDVIKAVEELNNEIYQFAARLADPNEFQFKPNNAVVAVEEADLKEVVKERVAGVLGAELVAALSAAHNDPFVCQIAFQSIMCHLCTQFIAAWSTGRLQIGSDAGQSIRELYERMRASEEAAISGRWRALTWKYAHEVSSAEAHLAINLREALIAILVAAGCTLGAQQVQESFATALSGNVECVVKSAQRLNQALGEGFTSCDYEMTYVSPGEKHNSATMEADTQGKDGEEIIATTDLGLVRWEKQGSELKDAILVKPKVLLSLEMQQLLVGSPRI